MEFPRAREHAITAIDACQDQSNSNGLGKLAPARMIQVANMYDVKKWLEPAYEVLAERLEMIDEEEAEMIGMKGVLAIVKARETRREGIRHIREAPVDDADHATGGKALPGDETRPPGIDSPESSHKVPGNVLPKTAAQSSMNYQPSVAAFEDRTDSKETANLYNGLKPVVRHRIYPSEPAVC